MPSRHRQFRRRRVRCTRSCGQKGHGRVRAVRCVRFGFADARRHLYNGRVLAPPYRRNIIWFTNTHTRTRVVLRIDGPPCWTDLCTGTPRTWAYHVLAFFFFFLIFSPLIDLYIYIVSAYQVILHCYVLQTYNRTRRKCSESKRKKKNIVLL